MFACRISVGHHWVVRLQNANLRISFSDMLVCVGWHIGGQYNCCNTRTLAGYTGTNRRLTTRHGSTNHGRLTDHVLGSVDTAFRAKEPILSSSDGTWEDSARQACIWGDIRDILAKLSRPNLGREMVVYNMAVCMHTSLCVKTLGPAYIDSTSDSVPHTGEHHYYSRTQLHDLCKSKCARAC